MINRRKFGLKNFNCLKGKIPFLLIPTKHNANYLTMAMSDSLFLSVIYCSISTLYLEVIRIAGSGRVAIMFLSEAGE